MDWRNLAILDRYALMMIQVALSDLGYQDELEFNLQKAMTTKKADFGIPIHQTAKHFKKSPQAIAEMLCHKIETNCVIAKVFAINGYVNFVYDNLALAKAVFCEGVSDGYFS